MRDGSRCFVTKRALLVVKGALRARGPADGGGATVARTGAVCDDRSLLHDGGSGMRRTAWQAAVEALEAEGVEYAFGLSGNPLHLLGDLHGSSVRPILARNESSAVYMAYGYARAARKVGVCFGNPGPGTTNMVSGMLEADSACAPVIGLSNGTVTRFDGAGALQELDVQTLMRPVTKWSAKLSNPAQMPWIMRRAFHLARSGRPGSVFVEVPGDLGLVETEMDAYRSAGPRVRSRATAEAVEALADALEGSRRPVILAGSGAWTADAGAALRAVAERIGAGVLTTPGGRGSFPEDHDLSLGQIGLYFTSAGRAAWDQADLVVSVGSRLEELQAGPGACLFPSGAAYAQIDADPFAIARNVVPEIALVGDAALVLDEVGAALAARNAGPDARAAWASTIADLKAQEAVEVAAAQADVRGPVFGGQAVGVIERVFGPNTILAHENGGHDLWSYYSPYYRVRDGGISIPPGEQTVMGIAVVGAIGAKLARPDLHVVCTTGDGAMQMSLGELGSAVAHKAPVTWVVFADGGFGWVQFLQRESGLPIEATDFGHRTDFVASARAQGVHGERVEHGADLADALDRARQANDDGVPALVEVEVARHEYAPGFVSFHRDVWGVRPRAESFTRTPVGDG
jgi:acetolactate synthase-1/2/3 large subunit